MASAHQTSRGKTQPASVENPERKTTRRREGSLKQESYYIDPERFTQMLLTYQETGDERTLEALITECFYPLALGVIRANKFKFVDQDDAIQESVIQCLKQIQRYNPNHRTTNEHSTGDPKRKAFAFFSTCAANTLRGLYRKEVSQIRGRQALFLHIVDKEHRNPQNKVTRRTRAEVMAGQECEG